MQTGNQDQTDTLFVHLLVQIGYTKSRSPQTKSREGKKPQASSETPLEIPTQESKQERNRRSKQLENLCACKQLAIISKCSEAAEPNPSPSIPPVPPNHHNPLASSAPDRYPHRFPNHQTWIEKHIPKGQGRHG